MKQIRNSPKTILKPHFKDHFGVSPGRLWRSWLSTALSDIMTYSRAGLVAELGDLRRATTFELKGLKAGCLRPIGPIGWPSRA